MNKFFSYKSGTHICNSCRSEDTPLTQWNDKFYCVFCFEAPCTAAEVVTQTRLNTVMNILLRELKKK